MKNDGFKVEYVQEFAKDLTYGKDDVKLSDQLLLLGEQHHRMFRLKDQVDYVIHDSPFVSGTIYVSDLLIPLKEYENLVLALYNRYEHLNIFLKSNTDAHVYQEYGRSQTLEQSIEKDLAIKSWLIKNNIPFHEVEMGKNASREIYKILGFPEYTI